MKLHDSSNDENQSDYGITDIGNLQPLSPTDQDGSDGDDVSKDVFRLMNELHQLIRPESNKEPDDIAAVCVMHQLARCLDYIGKTSDVLNQALSTQNLEVRLAAANVLAKLKGVDASAFLPVLAQAASSDDVVSRRQVADAIGDVGADAAPFLSIVLRDGDQMVRHFGLMSASCLGPSAASATSALIEILQKVEEGSATDEIPQVYLRMDACDALRAIGKAASEAVPHLLEVIQKNDTTLDDEAWLKLRAAHAHFAITSEIEPCLGIAVSMLDRVSILKFSNDLTSDFDTSFWMRDLACEILGEIGPQAQAAVPRLQRCLGEDQCETVRLAAQKALNSIKKEGFTQ